MDVDRSVDLWLIMFLIDSKAVSFVNLAALRLFYRG